MLTVLTWLWEQPGGRSAYTAHHVNIWAAMVQRHLSLPHRIACVTDIPSGIDPSVTIIAPPRDFEDVRIPTWGADRPQCLRRISLFRPDAAEIFGERFVSMDMDCVIAGSLDPLFDLDDDIVLYASPPSALPQSRPYNGSMVMMSAGARPHVFEDFTPEGAVEAGSRYAGSDQAWISHALGKGERIWSEYDGVFWWGRWNGSANARITFFPGRPKPWHLISSNDWIREHYRVRPGGRCLVLGYSPNVWADAEAALERGPFDAVIASPEAAKHWPGAVAAVAHTDAHADQLARIHGYDEVVWCGRSKEGR